MSIATISQEVFEMKETKEKHQLEDFQSSVKEEEDNEFQDEDKTLGKIAKFAIPAHPLTPVPLSNSVLTDFSNPVKASSSSVGDSKKVKEELDNLVEAKESSSSQRVSLSDLCNPMETSQTTSQVPVGKAYTITLLQPVKETIDYRSALTCNDTNTKPNIPNVNPVPKPTAPSNVAQSKLSYLAHREFLGKVNMEEIRKKEIFKANAEKYAEVQIKSTALSRLFDLYNCIHSQDSGISYIKEDADPKNNCILGFQQLEVKQPQFNLFIRKMVQENKLWHGLGGARSLKKPTWVIYELLRQIGVRPQKHCRGPKEHDPDPKDFMYATRYIFCRDTLVKNRHRLEVDGIAKGRPRDLTKVSSDNKASDPQHGNQGRSADFAGRASSATKTISRIGDPLVHAQALEGGKGADGRGKSMSASACSNDQLYSKDDSLQPHLQSRMPACLLQPPAILTASSSISGQRGNDSKGTDFSQSSNGLFSYSNSIKREYADSNKGEQVLSARAQYIQNQGKDPANSGKPADEPDDLNLQAACTALLSLASERVSKKERGTNKRSRSDKSATSPAKRSAHVEHMLNPAPGTSKADSATESPAQGEQSSSMDAYSCPKVVRSEDSVIQIFAQSRAIVYGSDFVDDELRSRLDDAVRIGEINPNSAKRLLCLHELLVEAQQEKIVTFIKSDDPAKNCILGWSKLEVHDPYELNLKVKKMVDEDEGGIWKKANGKYNQPLKNPTWGVYELFRKIGSKPCLRGPADRDPGKTDMFYYREWEFRNDESFRIAKKRLSKGFSQCQKRGEKEAQPPQRPEP
mmetsp:Transcript_16531/g.37738  ORF Transcript_16531/g.37738 Transcript_16531/m.37738 type:complete len:802 (-) Transcript_16531:918-3323(-)